MSIDTILGIAGTFLGVVGIATGYIFYLRGKREKEPCYSISEVNLIKGYSSALKDLKIKYKRKPIENLTVGKVAFWNNGKETINKDDIDTALPPMLLAQDNTIILDVKILETTNPANRFSVTLAEDGKSALIWFDYLNNNDGALLQVIHTGISYANYIVYGKIKGVKNIKYKMKKDSFFWLDGWFSLFIALGIISFAIIFMVKPMSTATPLANLVLSLVMGILGLILFGFWGYLAISRAKHEAKIPKELQMFYKEDDILSDKARRSK